MNSHYEELIERLYGHYDDYGEGRTQNYHQVCLDCKDAALALDALMAETAPRTNTVGTYVMPVGRDGYGSQPRIEEGGGER